MVLRCSSRFVLILSLLVPACAGGDDDGGGGGPGDGGDANDDDDDDSADDGGGPPSDVNGELRGVLYFDAPYEYVELDLSSGRQVAIRSRAGDVSNHMTPSADATEFVVTDDPLSGDLIATDLLLADRDGTATFGFAFAAALGRPKLSADGTRIALTLDDVPSVLDRDAEIVAEFPELEGARDMEWTPDGRLLIAAGESIHVVDPTLSDHQVLADFPGDRPDFLAVSPDGNLCAFSAMSWRPRG